MEGGLFVGGALKMHIISGLNQAMHLHHGKLHVHGSSHGGMVLSCLRSLMLSVLIRIKQWVVGWASSVH